MSDERIIKCELHGTQPETFVCQHIAQSLVSKQLVGFHWPADSEQLYPDAWCSQCQVRHERCGFEWKGEAADKLGAKLLCARCYLQARILALGQ